MANTPDSNSMWGSRFGGGPAAIMQEINASIPVDKRLWEEDITASRAHAAMLGACGIIAAEDAVVIDRGLAQIADEFAATGVPRSEEHTSELQSLMRISYAVFCLK